MSDLSWRSTALSILVRWEKDGLRGTRLSMTDENNNSGVQEAVRSLIDDEWEERHERPRGILTDTDRRFLWGIKQYEHQQTASNRRNSMRERVRHGILDLFFMTMLEDGDRNRVFEALEDTDPGSLESAVSSFIRFLYLGLDRDKTAIEGMVEHGIHNAETPKGSGVYQGGVKEVNVNIEIDYDYDAEEIYERYQSGGDYRLTPAEIGVLVREEMLDEDDLELLGSSPTLIERKDAVLDEG